MPRDLSLKKSANSQSGENLHKFVQDQAYSIQNQVNAGQQFSTVTKKIPQRNRYGDTAFRINGTSVTVTMSDSKKNSKTFSFEGDLSNFVAYKEAAIAPTVATDFPDDGNWGWYYDTATGYMYFPRNREGTLKNITITTLDGQITGTQHGNVSATAGTMHAFTQITGTITAAQHGTLSTGTLHPFTVISGTITDAQHGSLSGGTLHANANGSTAGFLTSAHYNLLAGATGSATADTLCLRDASGNINGAAIEVSNTKVVGARSTGWTAPTATQSKAGFANGATATEIEQNLSAVINALITHGLLGA